MTQKKTFRDQKQSRCKFLFLLHSTLFLDHFNIPLNV